MLRKRLSQVQTVVTINGCLGSAGGDITRKVRKNFQFGNSEEEFEEGKNTCENIARREEYLCKYCKEGKNTCVNIAGSNNLSWLRTQDRL